MNEITCYFNSLLQELEHGRCVMSVTITESLGSAPRGAGARMLVGENGRIAGTVGGGPVEYEVQQTAVRLLRKKASARRQYDLSERDSEVGMVCGGRVTASFHYISGKGADVAGFCRSALQLLKAPGELWLVLELPPYKDMENDAGTATKAGESMGIYGPATPLPPNFPAILPDYCRQNSAGIITCDGIDFYLEPIAKDSLVHIFGGGHVARALVPLLSGTGFSCAVYDDREDFIKKEDFPDAFGTAAVSFDRLANCLFPAAENYFVIMTRGHSFDLQAQAFAMRSSSVYIGVMGSRKKKAILSEKLRGMGFSQEELVQIHAPIGLDIGAETPAEIAVSIAAELIAVRNNRRKEACKNQKI